MAHFSKYIRPGAKVIGLDNSDDKLMVTAVVNPDGSTVIVLFNEFKTPKSINLSLNEKHVEFSIDSQAIQTIVIPKV
jgi:glucosylceramidase